MTHFLTKSSQYAIQAVMFLAAQPRHQPVFQREISQSLDIPIHFLGKVLQILVKHDLIISHKGINGGFEIIDETGKITLDVIVRIIDGDSYLNGCMVGFPHCSDEHPCPVHDEWVVARTDIMKILEEIDINQFSEELQSKLDFMTEKSKQKENEV